MFTEASRSELRDSLIAQATGDARLTGVAVTGSASIGGEDRWSDIDLAFGVGHDQSLDAVIADWTGLMYDAHSAVDHFDVIARSTVYRVFLLANSLQVDIAFAPEAEFGAIAPTFRLVSGRASEQGWRPGHGTDATIGMAWLYALHARSSLARNRLWQAEHMVSSLRDQVLALACMRHGLPAREGRGIDSLPPQVIEQFEKTMVATIEASEILRAFGSATELLISEIRQVDQARCAVLTPILRELVASSTE